jgi:hypothetical protein
MNLLPLLLTNCTMARPCVNIQLTLLFGIFSEKRA